MNFVFSNTLKHDFIAIIDGLTESILNKYFSRFRKNQEIKLK